MPPPPSTQSPLDEALALSIAGEHERALAIAGGLLLGLPSSPQALFLAARALGDLEQNAASAKAFELAVRSAVRAGNFPLAVAACCEVKQAGMDARSFLAGIARTFAAGSKHLLERGVPPEMTSTVPVTEALSERGAQLLTRVDALLKDAERLLADAANEPLTVAPQALFSALAEPALLALIGVFEEHSVDTGHVVIEEGTPGNEAFILARGELEVRRKATSPQAPPIHLARLVNGALFGEMSLLSRSPRAASVVACRPSIVLSVSKPRLDEVAKAEPEVGRALAQHTRRRMIENLVRTSSILGAVKAEKRASLLERFVTKTFEAGDKLIEQGQESSGLYLVASGSLSVVHHEDGEQLTITKLGAGEVVGEVALVLRRPSNADVVAEHPTVTLHLPRDQFLELIKKHPEVLAELYELAVKRDEETRSLVAQEATDADDFILL